MNDDPNDRKEWRPIEGRSFMPRWLSIALKAMGTTVGLIIAIPVGLLLLLIFFMRADHGPDVLAKVTIDIEVDGEPVLIERIIECQTFEVPGGEFLARLWKRAPTRYFPVVRGMGARLKSGGAIMMYTPYLCEHELEGIWPFRTAKVTPNPPGAVTMMAWTKDADDPEVLEIYASQAYFQHPEVRVKINRIEVSDVPFWSFADPPGEFEWFSWYDFDVEYLRKSGDAAKRYNKVRSYSILPVIPIGADIWGADDETSRILSEFTEPTLLDIETMRRIYPRLEYCFRANGGVNLERRGYLSWLPSPRSFRQDPRCSAPVFPRWDSESYPVKISEAGPILEFPTGLPRMRAQRRPLPFSTNGKATWFYRGKRIVSQGIDPSMFFTLIFDPETQTLFAVKEFGLNLNVPLVQIKL